MPSTAPSISSHPTRSSAPLHMVVPVKPFAEGKTRLAKLLGLAERVALNRRLLLRTLERAAEFPGRGRTIVVSRCDEVLDLVTKRGFQAQREPAPQGLNPAVQSGVQRACEAGAGAVLVMPVDLPLGDGDDLRRLVESAAAGPVCLLVPDHHGRGTNLLYQSPVAMLDFAFGPDSLARHRLLARRAGLLPCVRDDSVFGFDIDEPADYLRWRRQDELRATLPATPRAARLLQFN